MCFTCTHILTFSPIETVNHLIALNTMLTQSDKNVQISRPHTNP